MFEISLGVHARQGRVRARDAQGEALVEQLVRHHEPVRDLARERCERRSERKPEQDREGEEWNPKAPCHRGSVEGNPPLHPPQTASLLSRGLLARENRRKDCPCREPHVSYSSHSSRCSRSPLRACRRQQRMPIGFFDDPSFRFSAARQENLAGAAAAGASVIHTTANWSAIAPDQSVGSGERRRPRVQPR